MDAARDNRASTADRVFLTTHVEHCAACASEWVFLQATKTAWAKLPTAVPSASLSARIAAATYRKPTFSERMTAFFAFLQPAPVRVAIGVAAVAGLSFFVLPRLEMEAPTTVQSPVVAPIQPTVVPEQPKQPSSVAQVPAKETPAPKVVVKSTAAKPTVPAVKSPLLAAAKPTAPATVPDKVVAVVEKSVVEKPTPEIVKPTTKPKAVQVAMNKIKPIVERRTSTTESAPSAPAPVVNEPENNVAATSAPDPSSNAPKPSTVLTGMTAPETNPTKVDENGVIKLKLGNAGPAARGAMRGDAPSFVSNSDQSGYIVSGPVQ